MSINHFAKVMARKDSAELRGIIENENDYDEQAILAAVVELKRRNDTDARTDELGVKLATKFAEEEKEQDFNEKIFSKPLIYGLSGLLSPLIIGFFLAYNIWQLGNRKGLLAVLSMTLLYVPAMGLAFLIIPESLGSLISVVHLGYVLFFVERIWDKYIPTYKSYQEKKESE